MFPTSGVYLKALAASAIHYQRLDLDARSAQQ